MAIKKTVTKAKAEKKITEKKIVKKLPVKRTILKKPSLKKISIQEAVKKTIEKNSAEVAEKTSLIKEEVVLDNTELLSAKSEKSNSVWKLLSVFLLVIFTGILLYNFNIDFHSNFNSLAGKVGLGGLVTAEKIADKDDITKVDASAKAKDSFKLEIVYDKAEANQKPLIDQYLGNIETNLQNTKVEATWYDKTDARGQEIIAKLDAKFLPIFVTDETIKKHPKYPAFAEAIKTLNGLMIFQSAGMEYLKIPAVGNARFRGANPKTAKLVVIEYASLTCGYCKMMEPIIAKMLLKFKNEVSLVIKHYDRGGVDSTLAQAVECAGDQGAFDKMMDKTYEKQADLITASSDPKDPVKAVNDKISSLAKEVGINGAKVLECVKSAKYAGLINDQTNEAREFGIAGTPSMFIGKNFVGQALDESVFMKMIEDGLKK